MRRLPSGTFQARLMIDRVSCSETFATEAEANDWLPVTRARAISGGLPKRVTVSEYAARWMATYDTAPSSTRDW